jgi:hypothetical protein
MRGDRCIEGVMRETCLHQCPWSHDLLEIVFMIRDSLGQMGCHSVCLAFTENAKTLELLHYSRFQNKFKLGQHVFNDYG